MTELGVGARVDDRDGEDGEVDPAEDKAEHLVPGRPESAVGDRGGLDLLAVDGHAMHLDGDVRSLDQLWRRTLGHLGLDLVENVLHTRP